MQLIFIVSAVVPLVAVTVIVTVLENTEIIISALVIVVVTKTLTTVL